MNLEEGINRLSQLFMSANAFMEKNDYRAAIVEYNKIIELVQILRKPFDNGEVPLNLINEVFPKILQAEKAAKDGIFVAQFGIEAQKNSAENQPAVNPENTLSIDDINNPDVKQYTQHMQTAIDCMEKGDYNSALNEYNQAFDRLRILQYLVIRQGNDYPPTLVVETLDKLKAHEISVHQGLFSAYVRLGNLEKAAEEEKAIDTLMNPPAEENPVPTQSQYNSQSSGCFSAICFMFAILAALIFY